MNGLDTITFTCSNALFNQDLLYQLAYGHKAKICKYYLKRPYSILMLREFTESELLFMMPNNVIRRLGLPMTRMAGRNRNKRKYVAKRKYDIYRKHCHSMFGTAMAISENLI